mgnify:CR=1 FL=1
MKSYSIHCGHIISIIKKKKEINSWHSVIATTGNVLVTTEGKSN